MRLELTRRTDYAVRAMLVLARNSGQTIKGAEIARQTDIPVRFVTQVMSDLVRAELVGAVIGRAGGYRLKAAPESVSVLGIVAAVEGVLRREHCALKGGPCPGTTACEIHHVFAEAQDSFISKLGSWSLASIIGTEPVSRTPRGASPGTQRPGRGAAGSASRGSS
jgi:Rrf2 family protein